MGTGVKRTLFTKPSWAASVAPTAASDDTSIFGRNVVYEDILQAEKAKRAAKAAKAKARAEDVLQSERSGAKRRRISVDPDGDKDADTASDLEIEATSSPAHNRDEVKKKSPQKRVTRSTPKKEKALTEGLSESRDAYQSPRRRPRAKTPSVVLDDGDQEDDELVMLSHSPSKGTPSSRKKKNVKDTMVDEVSEEEEDEYLRELKQRAREKARLQRRGVDAAERPGTPLRGASTAAESTRSASVDQAQSRPVSSSSAVQETSRQTPTAEKDDDPEVKILIQSEIPNTRSLIVKRKASQSLKQVKEFWCRKFELDETVARTVYFTWKGTRLFDSTTMRGIILRLKKEHYKRQRRQKDDEEDEDEMDFSAVKDPSGGNIMLEATTPEIYEEQQRQKERQQAADNADGNASSDNYDNDNAAGAGADNESGPAGSSEDKDKAAIVIRLVSRDLEPMQLRVRPHTTITKIMRGYAATKKLDEGKTPWLIFDGERLEGDMTVEEVGLEDEDEVEVSIR